MSSDQFRVTFYGVRGSIPTPPTGDQIRAKLLAALEHASPEDLSDEISRKNFVDKLPTHINSCFGGNTSCVFVEVGGHNLIFDGGSGLRVLSNHLFQREFAKGQGRAHFFFSHTHWDHILGLPFFGPLYVPGNHFTICGVHNDMEERLRGQQRYEYFPISFDYYGSDIDFVNLEPMNEYKLGDVRISWKEMDHPGRSFTYKVEYKGKALVFSTDSEYKRLDEDYLQPTVDFFTDADLLVFDSQYTMVECLEKEDWGHSSTFIGIDLALRARVKQMAFYHHEPNYDDFKLQEILESSRDFLNAVAPEGELQLCLATEGQAIELL